MILPGSLNRSTKPVTCQTLQILDLEGNLVDDLDEVTSLEVGYGKRMLIKQKSVDQLRYYETWDVLILTNWCRISSLNSPNLKWWSLARNACNEVWDYIVKSCRNISKWCMQWSILFQFVACLRSSVTKTMGRCVVTFHSCQYFQRQVTFFVGCNYYDNLRAIICNQSYNKNTDTIWNSMNRFSTIPESKRDPMNQWWTIPKNLWHFILNPMNQHPSRTHLNLSNNNNNNNNNNKSVTALNSNWSPKI